MALSQYLPEGSDLWAAAGLAVSAAGIGVSIYLYRRAGRYRNEVSDDSAQFELGGGADAKVHRWAARFRFQLNGTGARSSRKLPSLHAAAHPSRVAEEQPPATREDDKQAFTLHQVAEAYESMTDAELGIASRELERA